MKDNGHAGHRSIAVVTGEEITFEDLDNSSTFVASNDFLQPAGAR